jgi:hypothetical protein
MDLDGTVHYTEPIRVDGTTSVAESVPGRFELSQNYPNPFNPETTILYRLASQSHVTLTVFDPLGRTVVTLTSDVQQPGTHAVRFDGHGLASGVYLYRLTAGNFVQTHKMLLVR